jgi:hypothetical protein
MSKKKFKKGKGNSSKKARVSSLSKKEIRIGGKSPKPRKDSFKEKQKEIAKRERSKEYELAKRKTDYEILHPTSELENLTAKRQKLIYRDKKGRIVSPEKLNGRKYVRWEIWRYSENTRKWKHINFGDKWKPKYSKLKRPKTPNEIFKLLEIRYGRHELEVRNIDGEIYALTHSI